jgi:hypothetical protein
LAPKERDPILDQQKSIILKPANFQLKALAMFSCENASYFTEVQEALKDDLFVEQFKERLCINDVSDEFEFKDEIYYFKGLLYVLLGLIQFKIIQMDHDLPSASTK